MVTEPTFVAHLTMGSSSSTTTAIPSAFSIPIVEKLTKTNYLIWHLQILSAVRAAQLEDLLFGAEKMPHKTISVKSGDTTVTHLCVLGQYTPCIGHHQESVSTMAEFYSKMKHYADETTAYGQPLSDEEFIAYVLTRLDEEFYNPLMSSIITRVEPISPSELYSQMLSYEQRVDKQSGGSYSSTNAATWLRWTLESWWPCRPLRWPWLRFRSWHWARHVWSIPWRFLQQQ
jgi:hypothetical protein